MEARQSADRSNLTQMYINRLRQLGAGEGRAVPDAPTWGQRPPGQRGAPLSVEHEQNKGCLAICDDKETKKFCSCSREKEELGLIGATVEQGTVDTESRRQGNL